MKTKKQNADFLHVGRKLIAWYSIHGRKLSFRTTKNPYKIWICEIVFQQTRIEQGLAHYNQFIKSFPNVKTLADAPIDDVLLHWKGLGYYSRAINIHHASQQIMNDFKGAFPKQYEEIISLKGIGKYTAAAISSICFGEKYPAVDGNFYRVLSRLFADDFDISSNTAFSYFSELALMMMPDENPGVFNQAMMDLGSEICKPRNPNCEICPLQKDCMAYEMASFQQFPVKKKKSKSTEEAMTYYFIQNGEDFLIKQRKEDSIWKKLYEFPIFLEEKDQRLITSQKIVLHKLTHKNLTIIIFKLSFESEKDFQKYATLHQFEVIDFEASHLKSFPKPLENYLKTTFSF